MGEKNTTYLFIIIIIIAVSTFLLRFHTSRPRGLTSHNLSNQCFSSSLTVKWRTVLRTVWRTVSHLWLLSRHLCDTFWISLSEEAERLKEALELLRTTPHSSRSTILPAYKTRWQQYDVKSSLSVTSHRFVDSVALYAHAYVGFVLNSKFISCCLNLSKSLKQAVNQRIFVKLRGMVPVAQASLTGTLQSGCTPTD